MPLRYQDVNLLGGSLDDLTNSLMRRRILDEQTKERTQKALLDREILSQRKSEADRQAGFEERKITAAEQGVAESRADRETRAMQDISHQGRIEKISEEAKKAAQSHYDQMESIGLFDKISQGIRDGTIDPAKIGATLESNPIFQRLGLGVNVFVKPTAKTTATETTIGGRRFAETRGGHLVPLDVPAPRPFSRTTVDPNDPTVRTTQRLTKEEYEQLNRDMASPQLAAPAGSIGFGVGGRDVGANILGGAALSPEAAAVQGALKPPAEPVVYNSEAEARAAGNGSGAIVSLMLNGKPTKVRLR